MDKYKTRVFSQFGQDGVIERIFDLVGTTNKYFVEFGSSGTDEDCGNTPYLRTKGFDGLLMDTDEEPYGKTRTAKYEVRNHTVTAENVVELFKKYNVPTKFDFLSIDIDGNDYYVWREILKEYAPRVVCIESNFVLPVDVAIVQPYDASHKWDGGSRYGASALALKRLGDTFGYDLVAVCGCDLIFVNGFDASTKIVARDIGDVEKLCLGEDLKIFDAESLQKSTEYALKWDKWITV